MRALLRPLPSRTDGLDVAAAQVPAERGAAAGGDLYEVVATEHGVRAVTGEVRGHGIGPFGTVAAVLGCFREAAHDCRRSRPPRHGVSGRQLGGRRVRAAALYEGEPAARPASFEAIQSTGRRL